MAWGLKQKTTSGDSIKQPTTGWIQPSNLTEKDRAALLRLGKKPVLKVCVLFNNPLI